ncbi:uncharacterized protein FFNC_15711 [Fusarium fujikuroi]|nr:uncharacterized protein FFNC_15711 [Fusarium fujikuroi]
MEEPAAIRVMPSSRLERWADKENSWNKDYLVRVAELWNYSRSFKDQTIRHLRSTQDGRRLNEPRTRENRGGNILASRRYLLKDMQVSKHVE